MTQWPLATVALVRDEKDDRLLPQPIRRQSRPMVKKATKRKALQIRQVRFCVDVKFVKKKRHVDLGILPCVKTTSLRPDAEMEDNVPSGMLRLVKSPSKKSKKGGAKGSVAILKGSAQLGCVSQDSHPRKSFPLEPVRLGSKHAVKFLQEHLAPIKNSGTKGSIARNYPKVCAS